MGTADSYRSYAADCVRQAEGATSPEEKNVLLNVALAWIRLAHQKQTFAEKKPTAPIDLDAAKNLDAISDLDAPKDLDAAKHLDAVKEASVADTKIKTKIVNPGWKRAPSPSPAA